MLMQTRMAPRAMKAVKKTGMLKRPWFGVTELIKNSNSDDEEDETAELLRELEKIKRERAEQKEKEASSKDESKRLRDRC